jgi:hypothetical protein
VFKNKVLRRIFGSKTETVTGGWRPLHNKELHDLYCSSEVITVNKSKQMRWVGHVANPWGRREMHSVWWRHPKKRDHLEDLSIHGS